MMERIIRLAAIAILATLASTDAVAQSAAPRAAALVAAPPTAAPVAAPPTAAPVAAPRALAQASTPSTPAQAPRALAHDPFDRGVVQQLMRAAEPPAAPSHAQADPQPATRALRTPAPATPPAPVASAELRAVLVGGARPLVNLGGSILGIGESAGGLRLVEVRERSAVFALDGAHVELSLGRGQVR